jgi:hypothetical protein
LQTLDPFIAAFTRLGEFLRQFPEGADGVPGDNISPQLSELNKKHFDAFSEIVETEHIQNPWFTRDSVMKALSGIALMLHQETLRQWLAPYDLTTPPVQQVRTVGLVMAGNIPLVGFHDLLCVLAAGHRVLAKPSSKDDRLIKKIAEIVTDIDPGLGGQIRFTDETLSGVDVMIATGSNNSARYFEYYFRNIPHIIRKNRNGIAVLTGEETEEDLYRLGEDIFTYFGMGCRNVTKIFIPESYDLKELLGVLDRFSHLYQHYKYGNNVDYYRTIFLMNQAPILDNGVLLLKEDRAVASPVGVVFYERYSEIVYVQQQLDLHRDEIQCIVSIQPEINGAIAPGESQQPMPWDYADGVDTIEFLKELG